MIRREAGEDVLARGGRGRVGARSADKVRGSAVRSADEVRAQRERGKKRQSVRRLALLVSFLLFPVIIFYFSPALIIEGALEGRGCQHARVLPAVLVGYRAASRVVRVVVPGGRPAGA